MTLAAHKWKRKEQHTPEQRSYSHCFCLSNWMWAARHCHTGQEKYTGTCHVIPQEGELRYTQCGSPGTVLQNVLLKPSYTVYLCAIALLFFRIAAVVRGKHNNSSWVKRIDGHSRPECEPNGLQCTCSQFVTIYLSWSMKIEKSGNTYTFTPTTLCCRHCDVRICVNLWEQCQPWHWWMLVCKPPEMGPRAQQIGVLHALVPHVCSCPWRTH